VRRIYKSRTQLAAMRAPGALTGRALDAVRAAIRPGVTTLELDAIAEDVVRSGGGVPNFQLEPGYRHTICANVNDVVVHGIPSDRPIEAGDLVTIDCGAMVDGWNGDAAFSVIVPGGSGELVAVRERLSQATHEGLWAGIAALASARMLGEVGAAVEDAIEAAGDYAISDDWIGHGIGRAMHEEPPVFNYRTRVLGPAVKPGLCVAIEPIVVAGAPATRILDDGWSVVTVDGSEACQWEHSVAVHADGIWVLTADDGGASGLAPFGIEPRPIRDR
jgi:methionyl aminopeptidase